MNTDPTVTISLDYLIEFCDDANQPQGADSTIIILPPAEVKMETSIRVQDS